ncbi:hypothetical protein R1sor_011152 [Riccia sorocarpa]|uniref:Uncharacterized protein n=1 Tax=Riccia sorocarpa TaxID=122646 RepID=A0ABD3I462_9MARC
MNLEEELQKLENEEAELWFLRSRSKWLEQGEVPTQRNSVHAASPASTGCSNSSDSYSESPST